jgi:hypothetical protein
MVAADLGTASVGSLGVMHFRRVARGVALAAAAACAIGCDRSGPLADLDAGWTITPSAAGGDQVGARDAGPSRDAGRRMPPRPVPITSPTVRVTMPIEVQLQAIQYMAAMEAPQPDDGPAEAAYAQSIAASLASAGKTDVGAGGRRIEIAVAKGCDASMPKQAIARHTAASLTTLLAHGVLVVRCSDHEVQCLQSTRDADDVLCTHK